MLLDHAPLLTAALLLALTACAALTDGRTGLIPNWLTLPALVGAAGLQWALVGPAAALFALGGVASCGLVPLLLFGLRAMGGGDVKLFGALGGLCGASLGLEIQLTAYVVAASLAVLGLAWRGELAPTLRRSLRLLRPRSTRAKVPAGDLDTAAAEVRLGLPIFLAALGAVARMWAGPG